MASGGIVRRQRKGGVRYEVVHELEPDPITGKRRQESHSFKTMAEAQRYRRTHQVDIDRGLAVDRTEQTVGHYLAEWLHTTARARVRPSTLACYESLIRTRIIPSLGHHKLQQLKPAQLKAFYASQLETPKMGRHRGTLSPRMVGLLHAVIHKALKDAEREEIVVLNVADKVSPPAAPKPQHVTWDRGQCHRFLVAANASVYGPVFLLALATAMRKGELLGLRWSDLDLDAGKLTVRQTLSSLKGNPTGQPKTPSSRRAIDLDPACVAALQAHQERQAARRDAFADAWRDHDLVFCAEQGQPIIPRNLTRHYELLMARAGVPRLTVHELRHTSATLLAEAGINIKVISERLGHAHISTTMQIYQHSTPTMQRAAANLIGSLLTPPPEQPE